MNQRPAQVSSLSLRLLAALGVALLALALRQWHAGKVPELSDELDYVGQARQIEQAISGGD